MVADSGEWRKEALLDWAEKNKKAARVNQSELEIMVCRVRLWFRVLKFGGYRDVEIEFRNYLAAQNHVRLRATRPAQMRRCTSTWRRDNQLRISMRASDTAYNKYKQKG